MCITLFFWINDTFLTKSSFFSMQVMLLGFVLLGRSLEERARIRASSDMNELLVSDNLFHVCDSSITVQVT